MHNDIIVINFSKMPKKKINDLIEETAKVVYTDLNKRKKSYGQLVVFAVRYDGFQRDSGHVHYISRDLSLRAYLEQHNLYFDKLISSSFAVYEQHANHKIHAGYTIQSRLVIPVIISAGKHLLNYAIFICSSKENSFDEKIQKNIRRLVYSKLNIRSKQQEIINEAILNLNGMVSAGEDEILKNLRKYAQEIVRIIRPGKMMCYVGLLEYDSSQADDNIIRYRRILFHPDVNDGIFDDQDVVLSDGEQHTIYLHPPEMRPEPIGIIARTIEGKLNDGKRVFWSQNIGDVSDDEDFIRLPNKGINTKSQLSVPIYVEHQILGAVCVEHENKNAFDENTVFAIEILANATFSALQTARLYNTIEYLSTFIHEDIEDKLELFDDILKACCRLIGAEFGGLGIVDEAGGVDYRFMKGVKRIVITPNEKSYSNYLLDNKLPFLYIRDLEDENDADIQKMTQAGYQYRPNHDQLATKSELSVPIMLPTDANRQKGGGTIIAIINLQSLEKEGFSDSSRDLVQAFAKQVASIIRNIRFASNLRELNHFAKNSER